jgi:hypothetical protein
MRLARSQSFRALLALAAFLAAVVAVTPPASHADATDDQIKALLDLDSAKDEGKCVAKMQEMKDSGDPRVLKAFKTLAKSKSDKVACSAIKLVGMNKKDIEFLKTFLISKIDDKELADVKDGRPEVYKCILETLVAYKGKPEFKPAIGKLEDVVKKYLSTHADYSTRAIRAYATVASPATVDQLLEWLAITDSRGQSQGGKNESSETRENKDKANQAILPALNELTGQDIGDATTWKKFWEEHKKGFQFPDPNKKEETVDVSTLKEYTDPTYGYTIKRPEGGGWHFQPKDEYCRIRLTNKDEQNVEWGRVDWIIHNTTTQTPKDVKGLADWYVNTGYKDEISEFTKEGSPAVTETKIAGRPFLLATAKGMGKGNREGWQSMERRVYITKCDYMGAGHLILYASLVVRNGADEEIKKKLYAAVETMTLKVTSK